MNFLKSLKRVVWLCPISYLWTACSKTDLDSSFVSKDYHSYVNLKVGNSWHYLLDSTALTSFGADTVVRHYIELDTIISSAKDLENNTTFKVRRYLAQVDANGLATSGYVLTNSYTYVLDSTDFQMVDENEYRFVKLVNPVTAGTSWDGNNFITKGGNIASSDPKAVYLNWNYNYSKIGQSLQMPVGNIANYVYVDQVNDSLNASSTDPTQYRSLLQASEIYGVGIGLVYQKFLHLVWNISSATAGYEDGDYGIERKLLSYHLQ